MADPTGAFDIDRLSPTQHLVLEVLAARHRLGETLWTFPSNVAAAVRFLEKNGLVQSMHGIEARTIRARLTAAGEQAALSPTFNPPNGGYDRLLRALEAIAEYAEERADLVVYMGSVADLARRALTSGDQR